MELFKLFGSIFIDSSEAEKSMAKTTDSAESMASKVGKGFGDVAKAGVAVGTAITSAAVAASTALIDQAQKSAETADEIDKMSQKMGMSAEGFQEWSYIMEQNGMDISKMQGGMKTLADTMTNAQNGNKKAIETFQALGISITDANGNMKSTEEVMNEAVFALAEMEEGAERTSLAMDVFGKAGMEMAPMLNQGGEAIEGLRDRAHELGLVMSDEAVAGGVEFGDLLNDLQSSLSMLVTNLGAELFPILNDVLQLVIEHLPEIQALFEELAPVFSDLLSTILPPLLDLAEAILPPLIDLIQQLAPFLADIASAVLPVITDLLQMLLPPLIQIVNQLLPVLQPLLELIFQVLQLLMPLLQPILDIVMALLSPLLQIVGMVLEPLCDLLGAVLTPIIETLTPIIEALSVVIESELMAAFEAIQPIIENVKGYFEGLIDFITGVFTGNWEQAWLGVQKAFGNIFEGLVNLVKAPMNTILGAINRVFAKIGTIVIPSWVPGIGGNTFSLPQLPMLAEGGDILRGGYAIVGEQGPEMLNLPQGARVTPLDEQTASGMSEDSLRNVITSAVAEVLTSVGINLELGVNSSNLFDEIVEQNTIYKNRHNGDSAMA